MGISKLTRRRLDQLFTRAIADNWRKPARNAAVVQMACICQLEIDKLREGDINYGYLDRAEDRLDAAQTPGQVDQIFLEIRRL